MLICVRVPACRVYTVPHREQRNGKQRKPAAPVPQPPQSSSGSLNKPDGTHSAGGPPGTAGSRGPSRAGSRAGSGRRIGTAASLASLESTMSPEEVLEFKLNKIKTVMRFANNDFAEASFPQVRATCHVDKQIGAQFGTQAR